jgi:uncharacterized protein (TIGR02058 family)
MKGGDIIMGRKRFIIEMGSGADLHGEDVTKAAQRAVKDAISRSCLCGLSDIFGINNPNEMYIEARIGCPYPERLDKAEVIKMIPFGSVNLEVVPGGLTVPGLKLPMLGEGEQIVIVVAALTVFIDI